MTVDANNMVIRLRRVMPSRWVADVAPFVDAVLCGVGTAHLAIYNLVLAVRQQARLMTANSVFLDMISQDFFGGKLPRRTAEGDSPFRQRIFAEMLRPRCTREALTSAMMQLTGQSIRLFEPTRSVDTGSYNHGGAGYGVAGGWGNLNLPYQSFIVVRRPHGGGIAQIAGYGGGGVPCYGNLASVTTNVTDTDIYALAAAIMPAGYTAWVQIQS